MSHIDDVEFTIFDTETTGLEPQAGDRIVEIAALRFKGKQRIATFQALVNPQRAISPAAFSVNKITPAMLAGAPTAAKVLPDFLKFIKDSCLCSYNAPFDLEFLNHELKLSGRPQLGDAPAIDVLKMARRLLPGLERYALWFVAESLGIKSKQEHRALSDVELTYGVFERLREALKTKGISDLEGYSRLFTVNPGILEDANSQRIASIQKAIDLKAILKIKYLSSVSAQVSEREVIPKEIRKDRGYSYLVGYCCLRQEERSFRVDGILHLEIV